MPHRHHAMLRLRPFTDQRHYLSVPRALFQSFIRLPVQARDQTLERALASVQGRARVLVCDANRVLLNPCHPARARQLIRRGQAHLVSVQPPVLQLVRAVVSPRPDAMADLEMDREDVAQ